MLAVVGATLTAGAARADDVNGLWLRDNGNSQVRFAPCGAALCGTIAWLKPGVETSSKIGQRVFYDMKPSGANSWAGTAFDPADGKTYKGTMTLSGSTLSTSGCVLGGLICKSVSWSRVR
jgi:uncharacterized protein (DUF2147 family)